MTSNLRNDWQDSTLILLADVTRSMIDAPIGVPRATEDQWKLVKQLAEWVETTAKNQRGYLDNMSTENKSRLELVKRRMKLLSTELDPQSTVDIICREPDPDGTGVCCVIQGHGASVAHMDTAGKRWA